MPDYDSPTKAEQRSPSIWPTALKFALIILAFRFLYGFLVRAVGLEAMPGIGLIATVITVVLLVLALRSYRRAHGGFMSFGQGFGIAFIASVVPAVINAAVTAVYLGLYGQDQLIAQREAMLDQVSANPGVDAQAMEIMTGMFEAIFTPAGIFIMGAIVGTIGWTLASLILAAVLKEPPPIAD